MSWLLVYEQLLSRFWCLSWLGSDFKMKPLGRLASQTYSSVAISEKCREFHYNQILGEFRYL